MKTQKAFLVLAAVLAGTSVYADTIKLSETPSAAKKAIQRRAGLQPVGNINRQFVNGQNTYEANWKDAQGVQQDFVVAENGQVLRDVTGATSQYNTGVGAAQASVPAQTSASANISGFANGQKAPLNWASETVQNKLKAMAGTAGIRNFQKGQYNGQTAYEGSFKTNNTLVTVVMGEDGTLLAQSPNLSATTTTQASGSVAGFSNAQVAPMNWASETVQNKFKQMANGSPIQNFEKGKFNGQTAYMGTFAQNGQSTTVIMGEDGTILSSTPSAVGGAPVTSTGTVTR